MKTKTYTSIRATWRVAATAAVLAIAGPLHAQINLAQNVVPILGPIQVRLAYTDKDGNAQDQALQQLNSQPMISQLPTSLFGSAVPGTGASALAQSQATPQGYFDLLWNNNSSGICADMQAQMANLHPNYPSGFSGSYQAYGFNCKLMVPGESFAPGVLTADLLNSWIDSSGATHTGTRLLLDYRVPANSISFRVTTPVSCAQATATCAQDPQYTLLFQVDLIVTADSEGQSSLVLPPVVSSAGVITPENVVGGDEAQAYDNDWEQFFESLLNDYVSVLKGGNVDPTALIQQAASALEALGEELASLGLSAIFDKIFNVSETYISAASAITTSTTAASAALTAAKDFESLYADLNTAGQVGFTGFSASAGDDDSLIFRLTYPAPVKPVVYNKVAQNNSMPSIIAPSISLSLAEVAVGGTVQVTGSYFPEAYSDFLVIGWSGLSTPSTQAQIQWGQAGGGMGPLTTSQDPYQFNNLKPSTSYTFQVQSCDAITCTPWSDPFTTTTEATNVVTFTLNNIPSKFSVLSNSAPIVIGTAVLGTDGTFSGTATIPLNTTAGSYILGASINGQSAGAPVSVCSGSGCTPSIGILGDSGGIELSGVVIGNGTVKGSNFVPGKTVQIGLNGTFNFSTTLSGLVATATVASDGTFEASFQLPSLAAGTYNLVAAEVLTTKTVQTPPPLSLTLTVPDQVAQASVSIFAQNALR